MSNVGNGNREEKNQVVKTGNAALSLAKSLYVLVSVHRRLSFIDTDISYSISTPLPANDDDVDDDDDACLIDGILMYIGDFNRPLSSADRGSDCVVGSDSSQSSSSSSRHDRSLLVNCNVVVVDDDDDDDDGMLWVLSR